MRLYDKVHKNNKTSKSKNVENHLKKKANDVENNHARIESNQGAGGIMKSKRCSSRRSGKSDLNEKVEDPAIVSNQNITLSDHSLRKSLRKTVGSRLEDISKKEFNSDQTNSKLDNINSVNTTENVSLKNNKKIDISCLKNEIELSSDKDLNLKQNSKKRNRRTKINNSQLESVNSKNHNDVVENVERECKYSNHIKVENNQVFKCSKDEILLLDTNTCTESNSDICKQNEFLETSSVDSQLKKYRHKRDLFDQNVKDLENELVIENCDIIMPPTIVPEKKKRGRKRKQTSLTCTEENNIQLDTREIKSEIEYGETELTFLNQSVENFDKESVKKNDETNCMEIKLSENCQKDNNKSEINDSHFNISYVARKGRPKKNIENGKNSNPVLYDESFLDNSYEEELNARNKKRKTVETIKKKDVVRCAKCNKYLLNEEWINHNKNFHNNLSWRDGETPIDLNDECLVKCILTKLCKKKKVLRCEKCRERKLSVFGLLSHEKQCGKTEEEMSAVKVTCTICQRIMLPASLEIHNAKVHQTKVIKKKEETYDIPNVKGKRNAATKALDRFKEFNDDEDKREGDSVNKADLMYNVPSEIKRIPGLYLSKWKTELNTTGEAKCRSPGCEFISDTINVIKEHYPKCTFNSRRAYSCKKCKFIADTESEIVTHIKSHNDFEESEYDDDDDDDDEEEEDDDLGVEKINKLDPIITSKFFKALPFKNQNEVSSYTYKQTKEYYSNCLEPLYIKKNPVWHYIDVKNEYLPSTKESLNMATLICHGTKESVLKKDLQWRRLQLFESENQDNQSIIFCGGPVWALGWIPMLEVNDDQYLAVSCNRDMDKFHEIGSLDHEEGLIQIWNFGLLNDSTDKLNKPKLSFCIAHNYGPIWGMAWCPRGCYQSEKTKTGFKRLGIVAVTSSDGLIYVLSIPSPDDISERSIISVQPVFKLTIGTIEGVEDFNIQPTKVTWCKNGDHSLLAGGFNNGLVGLWNLNSTSSLLKTEKNSIVELLPYHVFYPHKTIITGLDFSYFNENRWLLTSALDMGSKIWDLEDLTIPVSINKKATATDAIWCAHWNCCCVCYDNSCLQLGSGSTLTSVREWGFKTIQFYGSNSAVGCLSQNMWLNGIVQCSSVGETQLILPTNLFFGVDADNVAKRKCWIIGHTEYDYCVSSSKDAENSTIDLNKNDDESKENLKLHEEPSQNYNDMKERFGIIFKDYKLDSSSIVSEKTRMAVNFESKKLSSIGIYPIESINRVSWNPNPQSHKFLAFGYQAGFLRVRCIDFSGIKIGRR